MLQQKAWIMRRLAFLFVFMSLTGTAAFADGLDDATLRGSSGFEAPARGAPVYAADAPYYPLEDDMPVKAPVFQPVAPAVREIWVDVGGRFWYSTGTFSKDLYGDPRFSNDLLSRLTYGALSGRSYEMFGRVDHVSGFFLKGYAALGSISAGTLHDEDFPPGLSPYSNTLSDQQNGKLSYFTLDYGYNFLLTPMYRVGAFVGYNIFNESENAYGCTQTQSNPFVCVPTIPHSVLGITENSRWQSIRLGLAADTLLFDCIKIGGDAAWVPRTYLRSFDTHWLRPDFFSPIYESAQGSGAQFEAFATYNFNPAFSVGVGARYWRLTAKGTIDVEDAALFAGAVPNPGTFYTDRYGVYAQASYKFGLD